MQAVILAAGKSTRTYPLTLTKPKPLLKAANKTLLEHNLDNLNNIVNEVIIVIGYKKNLIKGYIGHKYQKVKIKYAEQKKQTGTWDALLKTQKHIKNEFVSFNADDIYSKQDFKNVLRNKYSILVKKVKNPENFGVVLQKNKILMDLIEKPKRFVSNLANTGLYKVDKQLFSCLDNVKKSKRGEYELTEAVKQLASQEKINCVFSKQWIPIGYPWDLLKADNILRSKKNNTGKNSKIIGNLKNSSVGSSCTILGSVKNSIIMDNSIITKDSIVEDSIIGENVNFDGKAISKKNAYSTVKNKKIKVDRLGAILADNVKAENVIIHPGCKIWPNKRIQGEIKNDVE
jgi:UDP-N-acetylglucosamine diphosphorylase / glucose-1-phosphate thymidylyltransferase / UDP-N-acetylgalactosamine diphosphorylase / glucosamine-1-phosphate N-acetyltransferase / galactosamine-1-phosphate N-acetyltransferase